jgi:hypothetical protein
MTSHLLAVLVRRTATIDSIDVHLALPMRRLLRTGQIDGYRLGGGYTGAWDPGYDASLDPRNWRTCDTCGASTRLGAGRCTLCAEAVDVGDAPGTVPAGNTHDWASHPGDIVALATLLEPGWRYPKGHTPEAWVDLAGTVWLGTTDTPRTRTDTGETPPRLRRVFHDLHTSRRNPDPALPRTPRGPFNPDQWAVAVVDARR